MALVVLDLVSEDVELSALAHGLVLQSVREHGNRRFEFDNNTSQDAFVCIHADELDSRERVEKILVPPYTLPQLHKRLESFEDESVESCCTSENKTLTETALREALSIARAQHPGKAVKRNLLFLSHRTFQEGFVQDRQDFGLLLKELSEFGVHTRFVHYVSPGAGVEEVTFQSVQFAGLISDWDGCSVSVLKLDEASVWTLWAEQFETSFKSGVGKNAVVVFHRKEQGEPARGNTDKTLRISCTLYPSIQHIRGIKKNWLCSCHGEEASQYYTQPAPDKRFCRSMRRKLKPTEAVPGLALGACQLFLSREVLFPGLPKGPIEFKALFRIPLSSLGIQYCKGEARIAEPTDSAGAALHTSLAEKQQGLILSSVWRDETLLPKTSDLEEFPLLVTHFALLPALDEATLFVLVAVANKDEIWFLGQQSTAQSHFPPNVAATTLHQVDTALEATGEVRNFNPLLLTNQYHMHIREMVRNGQEMSQFERTPVERQPRETSSKKAVGRPKQKEQYSTLRRRLSLANVPASSNRDYDTVADEQGSAF